MGGRGWAGVGSKMKGVVVNTWIPVTFVINYPPHIPPMRASLGCCDRDLSLCAPNDSCSLGGNGPQDPKCSKDHDVSLLWSIAVIVDSNNM